MVETDLTLVDYFAVIGFDKSVGLKPDHSADVISDFVGASTSAQAQPPLERSYVARVLNHFPEKRSGFPFIHEVASLCMPKGLRFYTEKSVPLEPKFHSFVNIKEDGTRINGCCLTLYEEVRDEHLRQQMVDLQMEHVKELATSEKTSERVHHPPGTVSGGNHTLPRHISARKNKNKRISYYDSTSKPIFVAKCICLITRIPLIYTAEKILRGLADMISVNRPILSLPMESIIYWFLHEAPLPSLGTTLRVPLNDCDLIVKRPGVHELPFFDYPFQTIFSYIKVDQFVKLLTCFLLEHQILLCSKHLDRLMLVAESLTSFVFPFRWNLTYVPILPYSQLKFIEAPVPYLMGLCYDDQIPDQIFQSNICILDIDKGRLDLPEDVPPFPRHRSLTAEIIEIINKFRDFCLAEMQATSSTSSSTDSPSRPKVVMRRTTALQNVVGNGNSRLAAKEQWSMKRMSRSFDDHAAIEKAMDLGFCERDSSLEEEDLKTMVEEVDKNEVQRNSSFKMDESTDENFTHQQTSINPEAKAYLQGLKFNNAIRELILYHFGCLFHNYESFLISDTTGHDSMEGYMANRDSVVNFDKASFLSDQPDSYLPFLAAFLETQMFTSFVDSKILSQWQKPDENVVLFDQKLAILREKLGVANTTRTPIMEKAPSFAFSEDSNPCKIDQLKSDYDVPRPHTLAGAEARSYHGIFPDLEPRLFENRPLADQLRSPWKERRPKQRVMNVFEDSTNRLLMSPQKKLQDLEGDDTDSPKKIAHQNWKFVEQLLKETKTKTKRMLVVKMGKEAVHLGHNDLGITGVEENTLVAGFCDLLERVWAHGLKKKQGKSAFWMHVLSHQEKEKSTEVLKMPDSSSNMSPAYQNDDYPQQENVSGLSELLESVRQEISNIARSYEQSASSTNEAQDDSWSKSFLRAANFIADKLNTQKPSPQVHPTCSKIDQNGNKGQDSWPPAPFPRRARISATPGPSMDVNRNVERPPIGQVHRGRTETSAHVQDPRIPRSASTQGRSRLPKMPSFSDFPNWASGSNGNQDPEPSSKGGTLPLPRHRAVSHERKRSLSRPRSPIEYERQLTPLSTHISYDLKNILRMTEIKTDIGFARAFVRLALERKLLYKHLKAIMSNTSLLQKMYKRYAFLRCEEEREQFLYHILSLNAVDFSCFTHTFISTKMQYEVLLVAGIDRYHASNIWIMITGSLGSTNNISLPANSLQFTFDHKNLGVLSTMRIGHILRQNEKHPSKWFLDYVLVRNNITGQTFRFNCGRYFGRGVDDGALERLLVADVLPRTSTMDPESHGMSSFGSTSSFGGLISRPESPVSSVLSNRGYSTSSLNRRSRRSPSVGRSNDVSSARGTTPRISELEHLIGSAVNALVKHFFTDKDYSRSAQLTPLLCGENGLVPCLEQVFSLGRQDSLFSNRFFRQPYPWDYIEKVFAWFANFFRNGESRKLTREQRHLIIYAYNLVVRISAHSAAGKEGKFSIFILLTLRDHILAGLLPLMAWTPVTAQMYDESAFLRQPHHLSYLSKLIASLNEFNFTLEKSLTYGLDL